jgi:hypothetical protein
MSTIALSGQDTVTINNRTLNNLADGTYAELSFPNQIAFLKVGKNGNSIYGLNETGKAAELKLRVIRASSDDEFLNQLLSNQQANFAGAALMLGTFVKNIGDGQGNVTGDTYILAGGIFTKQVEGKSDAEGGPDQSVSMYNLMFSSSPRILT